MYLLNLEEGGLWIEVNAILGTCWIFDLVDLLTLSESLLNCIITELCT